MIDELTQYKIIDVTWLGIINFPEERIIYFIWSGMMDHTQ